MLKTLFKIIRIL